jgi:hypothetical protein
LYAYYYIIRCNSSEEEWKIESRQFSHTRREQKVVIRATGVCTKEFGLCFAKKSARIKVSRKIENNETIYDSTNSKRQ